MLHLLFGWRGRANRAQMWLFALIGAIAYGAAIGAFAWVIEYDQSSHPHTAADPATTGTVIGMIFGLGLLFFPVFLLLFYCSLAVMAKRLHDRGKSAWWVLVFVVGPTLISGMASNAAQGAGENGNMVSGAVALVALGIWVWAFVELYCLRGTVGDNAYGPDPLAGKA